MKSARALFEVYRNISELTEIAKKVAGRILRGALTPNATSQAYFSLLEGFK